MKKLLALFLIVILSASILISCGLQAKQTSGTNNLTNSSNTDVDDVLKKAEKLKESGDYLNAIKTIDLIKEKDQSAKTAMLRDEIISEYKGKIVLKVNSLIMKYDYAGAKGLMDEIYPYVSEKDNDIKKLYDTCIAFQELEPYKGVVEHIFFHPLIAYPELTFDGDSQSAGFDNYFVTVSEFKKIIQQLYEKNYVLIDIRLLYKSDEDGRVKPKELMLPKGKKPLILSMDDYNFLKYMRKNGMVHGLALNENGDVVTYTDMKDGKRVYSDDNEIVPILDKFVKEHPDFSFGGIKGVIGLNGYEGALGFPTDELKSPDYNKNLEESRRVANRLKETGWAFACHSYSHYSPKKRTLAQFKYDVDKWQKEVGAVVGGTDIYIYPFGEQIKSDDPKFKYMLDKGYRIFCGVSARPYLKFYDNYVLQMRRNIDGIAFRKNRLSDILDVSQIVDPVRPWVK